MAEKYKATGNPNPGLEERAHNLILEETTGRHAVLRLVSALLDRLERLAAPRHPTDRDPEQWGLYRVSHGSVRFLVNVRVQERAEALRLGRQCGIQEPQIAYFLMQPGVTPDDEPEAVRAALDHTVRYCSEHGEFEKDRSECPYCIEDGEERG